MTVDELLMKFIWNIIYVLFILYATITIPFGLVFVIIGSATIGEWMWGLGFLWLLNTALIITIIEVKG